MTTIHSMSKPLFNLYIHIIVFKTRCKQGEGGWKIFKWGILGSSKCPTRFTDSVITIE